MKSISTRARDERYLPRSGPCANGREVEIAGAQDAVECLDAGQRAADDQLADQGATVATQRSTSSVTPVSASSSRYRPPRCGRNAPRPPPGAGSRPFLRSCAAVLDIHSKVECARSLSVPCRPRHWLGDASSHAGEHLVRRPLATTGETGLELELDDRGAQQRVGSTRPRRAEHPGAPERELVDRASNSRITRSSLGGRRAALPLGEVVQVRELVRDETGPEPDKARSHTESSPLLKSPRRDAQIPRCGRRSPVLRLRRFRHPFLVHGQSARRRGSACSVGTSDRPRRSLVTADRPKSRSAVT